MNIFVFTLFTVIVLGGATYFGFAIVQTPTNVNRLVCRFGIPVRKQVSGIGIIWPLIEVYYNYSTELFEFELGGKDEEGDKVFTDKSADGNIDEAHLILYATVYVSLPGDLNALRKLWEKGLRLSEGDIIDSGEHIKNRLDSFIFAVQRNIAGPRTWRDIVYKKNEFENEVNQTLIDPQAVSGRENPFVTLGIDDVRYVLKKVSLPADLESALHQMAVEKNKGEALREKARHEAYAADQELSMIDQHTKAAAIRAIEKSNNRIIIPFDTSSIFNKILGG